MRSRTKALRIFIIHMAPEGAGTLRGRLVPDSTPVWCGQFLRCRGARGPRAPHCAQIAYEIGNAQDSTGLDRLLIRRSEVRVLPGAPNFHQLSVNAPFVGKRSGCLRSGDLPRSFDSVFSTPRPRAVQRGPGTRAGRRSRSNIRWWFSNLCSHLVAGIRTASPGNYRR